MPVICYPSLGSVEKVSERRGYWDPKRFPFVAAFAALPREKQIEVVVTCKLKGFNAAVELVPACTVAPQK